jgi:S-adenosylmethionine hydrolase
VLDVDRFGNLALNVSREHLDERRSRSGDRIEVQFALDPLLRAVAETYADAQPGELILYEDSYGAVAIAMRDGNAARLTGAAPGDARARQVTAGRS